MSTVEVVDPSLIETVPRPGMASAEPLGERSDVEENASPIAVPVPERSSGVLMPPWNRLLFQFHSSIKGETDFSIVDDAKRTVGLHGFADANPKLGPTAAERPTTETATVATPMRERNVIASGRGVAGIEFFQSCLECPRLASVVDLSSNDDRWNFPRNRRRMWCGPRRADQGPLFRRQSRSVAVWITTRQRVGATRDEHVSTAVTRAASY